MRFTPVYDAHNRLRVRCGDYAFTKEQACGIADLLGSLDFVEHAESNWRTGSILGVKVPLLTIPVKPGRNLAVILEVAAMNNRQKKMGYNAAKDLLHQLGIDSDSEEIMSDLNI